MQDRAPNQAEWSNPANWSGWIYFSKKDSRLWVPKRIPALGWTINLGHRHGPHWLMGTFGGIILLIIAIYVALTI